MKAENKPYQLAVELQNNNSSLHTTVFEQMHLVVTIVHISDT